jgi:hypothetical protein
MSDLDDERLLSMSTFEAAYTLRRFRRLNPTYLDEQLVECIRSIRADFYPNDYEAGIAVERIVDSELDATDDTQYFKAAIEGLISRYRPLWIRLAPGGREHVLRAVSTNGAQCFRNAGLLDAPPSKATSDWWDELAARVRNERDARLMEQGREAERLSFEFECNRLQSMGILKEPRWVAIEDNEAGFDILSYDEGRPEPVNRLIEVKSSTQFPPRMIITRGEWDAAVKYNDAYVFHLWSLPNKTFVERRVADIAPHIPIDQGVGIWAKVEIVFAADAQLKVEPTVMG